MPDSLSPMALQRHGHGLALVLEALTRLQDAVAQRRADESLGNGRGYPGRIPRRDEEGICQTADAGAQQVGRYVDVVCQECISPAAADMEMSGMA